MNHFIESLPRFFFSFIGSLTALLEPTVNYLLLCTIMILVDCLSAWMLSRRAHKVHPDRASEDAAKFKSKHFGDVIATLCKSWILIILAYGIQVVIINETWPIDLTKIAAGAICFWQLWSILENESSCNDAKWAKILQKILVDKTSRHFDIDLSDLKPEEE